MLLKPAAAQAVSEVSKKKPGPRPGGASTAGGTAQSGQPRAVLPPALRSSLPRTPVPSDRGLRRSFLKSNQNLWRQQERQRLGSREDDQ